MGRSPSGFASFASATVRFYADLLSQNPAGVGEAVEVVAQNLTNGIILPNATNKQIGKKKEDYTPTVRSDSFT